MPSMSSQPNTTSESGTRQAVIALGANIDSPVGSPAQTLRTVLDELAALGPLQASSLFHTAPVDSPPGSPDFVNAVALVRVPEAMSAHQFLHCLQDIELRYGRDRSGQQVANAPRPLDLDLICFGDQVINDEVLTLPHPRAHQRRFVLEPLAEVAADLVLPGCSVSVRELLLKLP